MIQFMVNWLIGSFINGLIFFLIFVAFFYWFYVKELPTVKPPQYPQFEKFKLSDTLKNMLNMENLDASGDSIIAFNMICSFLFQELKDTSAVRRYIMRKLNFEFKELITTKKAGIVVEKITVRDFSLGTNIPIVQSIYLQNYKLDEAKDCIQELTLYSEIEYNNGFSISVDVALIWGQSAFVHIKIASIKGKVRLHFTRHPFTHWSFSFIDDPDIVFEVSSQFDGKQISQITTLITNQLKKSVRKKYTMPNYKIRFKPFFEPVYDQSLFKSHINNILLKLLNSKFNNLSTDNTPTESESNGGGAINSAAASSENENNISNLFSSSAQSKSSMTSKKSNAEALKADFIKNAKKTSILYESLCQKLGGVDLASVGRLEVSFNSLEKLPEALYSLNLNSTLSTSPSNSLNIYESNNLSTTPSNQVSSFSIPKSMSVNQISIQNNLGTPYSSNIQQQDACFIYLTISVDSMSMTDLMKKTICKEHWPLIEFDVFKVASSMVSCQTLGIQAIEVFLVNKVEVVVQRIASSLLTAAAAAVTSKNISSLDIKQFDIIYSVNQVKISSIKQLNRLIQKTPLGKILHIALQRPCIILSNPVKTSQTATSRKSLNQDQLTDQVAATVAIEDSMTPLTNLQAITPVSNVATTPVSSSSNIMATTRSKLEQIRNFQKIKFPFVSGSNSSQQQQLSTIPSSRSAINISRFAASNDVSDTGESSAALSTTPISTPNVYSKLLNQSISVQQQQQPTPQISNVTHTTSSSNLVEFFCSASECSINDQSPVLDLISLLTNESSPNNETLEENTSETLLTGSSVATHESSPNSSTSNAHTHQRAESYFKRTRDIKLEKENLLSINNNVKPIPIMEEKFSFELNKHTKFVNIFMWTVKYTPKAAKQSSLLIGYITLPVAELSVDCWLTSRGETQSFAYFKPLEEMKAASVISRLPRSHVISDHPGFDPNVSIGLISLNFKHKLNPDENNPTPPSAPTLHVPSISVTNTDQSFPEGLVMRTDIEQQQQQQASNLVTVDEKDVVSAVADSLTEKYNIETEIKNKMATGNFTNLEEVDDGSMHRFVSVQFNEKVNCAFCNNKIWFKNAYQCAFCGYIIHFKCYEKTIGKSICPRFYKKQSSGHDDQFEVIHSSEIPATSIKIPKNEPTRSHLPLTGSNSNNNNNSNLEGHAPTKSSLSNFISGIRQRAKRLQDVDLQSTSQTSTSTSNKSNNSILNTFYSNLRVKNAKSSESLDKKASDSLSAESNSILRQSDEDEISNSGDAVDDFKDFDPNSEEKLFGVDLFDELPMNERRVRFEETIERYQAAIEMMLKLKMELESEFRALAKTGPQLKTIQLDSSSVNRLKLKQQQEINLKSQIKHMNEQIKGVQFLLMQCQMGLANCNEMTEATAVSIQPTPSKNVSVDAINSADLAERNLNLISFDDNYNEKSSPLINLNKEVVINKQQNVNEEKNASDERHNFLD